MDPLSAAITVCSVCTRILTWMDQLAEKTILLNEISSTVLQVQSILGPFESNRFQGTGEQYLSQSICCVGDVLRRVDEHLSLYHRKKRVKILAILLPDGFNQKLKEHSTQLSQQLVVLLVAMAAVGYFRDHQASEALSQKHKLSDDGDKLAGTAGCAVDGLLNLDAREFWKDYIGSKVDFVSNDLFCDRLALWSNGNLSKKSCELIIMRLDEFNSGVVTPQNLIRALGHDSFRTFVDLYKSGEPSSMNLHLAPTVINRSVVDDRNGEFLPNLRVPLLVWVDDHPENISYEVRKARAMGIHVVELPSTAAAKVWVDENAAFLHEHNDSSCIRFISDNVRLEETPYNGLFLNASAGQNLLQYLRGRLFHAPVLIYTHASIGSTGFVMEYEAAGSTACSDICLDYIANLAGVSNDKWRGFDVYSR